VEQTAIKDRVERLTERLEVKSVADDEARWCAPLAGFGLGETDRSRRDVDARCITPGDSGHQHVLTRAAPHVEHRSAELAVRGERREVRLWPADVPRRRRRVRGLELGKKIALVAHGSSVPRPDETSSAMADRQQSNTDQQMSFRNR
jgi:hypothetical protein